MLEEPTSKVKQDEISKKRKYTMILTLLIVGTLSSIYIAWSWEEINSVSHRTQQLIRNMFEMRLLSPLNKSKNNQALLITLAAGDYWYKPLVKANRANYCARHGYTCLFIEQVEQEESVAIHWTKMAEVIRNLGEDSPYEWILLTDVDSYIMNFNMSIPMVVDFAFSDPSLLLNKKYFNLSDAENTNNPTAESVDIMVAVDNDDINVGTMLFRNTNFTRYLMNEMWIRRKDNGRTIPKARDWPEQGVFIYLCRIWPAMMHKHLALVHQKVFNSYGWQNDEPHYQYKRGEFLIHFPGKYKEVMSNFTHELLSVQPELIPVALKHPPPA